MTPGNPPSIGDFWPSPGEIWTGEFWKNTQFMLQLLLNSIPSWVEVRTSDGVIRLMNRAGLEFLQKTPDEIIGKRDSEIYPPELLMFIQFSDQLISRGGSTRQFEESFEIHGETYFFEFTKIPLRDPSNQTLGYLTIAQDLSTQKKAEEDLSEATRLLQSLICPTSGPTSVESPAR